MTHIYINHCDSGVNKSANDSSENCVGKWVGRIGVTGG